MTDQQPDDVTVRDNPGKGGFDVFVDGALAGTSLYTDVGEGEARQRVFFHTEVGDEFGGRGLAGTLTRSALEESVGSGLRIVAVCPYVKRWLTTHHDLDDAVDRVRPEHLQAVRAAAQKSS
jgi:uncharacterized protein